MWCMRRLAELRSAKRDPDRATQTISTQTSASTAVAEAPSEIPPSGARDATFPAKTNDHGGQVRPISPVPQKTPTLSCSEVSKTQLRSVAFALPQ